MGWGKGVSEKARDRLHQPMDTAQERVTYHDSATSNHGRFVARRFDLLLLSPRTFRAGSGSKGIVEPASSEGKGWAMIRDTVGGVRAPPSSVRAILQADRGRPCLASLKLPSGFLPRPARCRNQIRRSLPDPSTSAGLARHLTWILTWVDLDFACLLASSGLGGCKRGRHFKA